MLKRMYKVAIILTNKHLLYSCPKEGEGHCNGKIGICFIVHTAKGNQASS